MDDVNDRATVSPRPEAQPVPVCTIMSDGTFRVEAQGIGFMDLYRLIEQAGLNMVDRAIGRAAAMESVLVRIKTRYQGFDDETATDLDRVLGAPR